MQNCSNASSGGTVRKSDMHCGKKSDEPIRQQGSADTSPAQHRHILQSMGPVCAYKPFKLAQRAHRELLVQSGRQTIQHSSIWFHSKQRMHGSIKHANVLDSRRNARRDRRHASSGGNGAGLQTRRAPDSNPRPSPTGSSWPLAC